MLNRIDIRKYWRIINTFNSRRRFLMILVVILGSGFHIENESMASNEKSSEELALDQIVEHFGNVLTPNHQKNVPVRKIISPWTFKIILKPNTNFDDSVIVNAMTDFASITKHEMRQASAGEWPSLLVFGISESEFQKYIENIYNKYGIENNSFNVEEYMEYQKSIYGTAGECLFNSIFDSNDNIISTMILLSVKLNNPEAANCLAGLLLRGAGMVGVSKTIVPSVFNGKRPAWDLQKIDEAIIRFFFSDNIKGPSKNTFFLL